MSAAPWRVALQAVVVVGGSIVGALSAHLFLAKWLLERTFRELGLRLLVMTHPDELTGTLQGIVLGVGVAPWFAVPALIVEHLGGRRPPWWVGPIALAAVWLGVALALARRISWMAAALAERPNDQMSVEPMTTVSSLELGSTATWGGLLAGVVLTVVAVVRLRRIASPRRSGS